MILSWHLWRPTEMKTRPITVGKLGEHPVTVFASGDGTFVYSIGSVATRRFAWVEKAPVLTSDGGKAFSFRDKFKLVVCFGTIPRETDFVRVRLRAFVYLVLYSGLRPSECLALNVDQVLEHITPSGAHTAKSGTLRPSQRSDGRRYRRTQPRPFPIPPIAQDALFAYIRAAIERKWIERGHWRVPLFMGARGRRGARGHGRLKLESIARSWRHRLQTLGMGRYSLHDLRHEAIRTYAGSAEEKAQFGCVSVAQAETIYTDADPAGVVHIVRGAGEFIREVAKELGIDDDDESLRDLLACEQPGPSVPPAVP